MELRTTEPQIYTRQALVLGDLENIADALLKEDGKTVRALLFAEFEELLEQRSSKDDSLQELVSLFVEFSPQDKPVLARMLLTQACLAQIILSTYHQRTDGPALIQRLEEVTRSSELRTALAWQEVGDTSKSFLPIQEYLGERLGWLRTNQSWLKFDKPQSG